MSNVDMFHEIVMKTNCDGTVSMDLENQVWPSEGGLEFVRKRQNHFLENLIPDFVVMLNPGRIFLKKVGVNKLLVSVL